MVVELDPVTLMRRQSAAAEISGHADMIRVPGGTFRMGSDRHCAEEAPVHRVTVDAFWIDRAPVTNREFRDFVRATGYVTVAEIAPDPQDYPGALPNMLKAGSLVFNPPKGRVDAPNSHARSRRGQRGVMEYERQHGVHFRVRHRVSGSNLPTSQ
jgi:formylglycine-generating enzyme required for sulfatase activity